MKVIIYAAGIASRLSASTGGKLKSMVELGTRPLIDYQLGWIRELKPEKIIIVLGMEHESLRKYVGEVHAGIPVTYYYNEDYRTKGNMLSFWVAKEECTSDILFTTSDLLCPYENISKFLKDKAPNKILVDDRADLLSDDDPVKVKIENGLITTVLKRIPRDECHAMAIGLYKFDQQSILKLVGHIQSYLDRGDDNKSLYYPINDLAKTISVTPVKCIRSEWFDIDTPEELNSAREYVSLHAEYFQGLK